MAAASRGAVSSGSSKRASSSSRSSGRDNPAERTYDPKTGKWTKSTTPSTPVAPPVPEPATPLPKNYGTSTPTTGSSQTDQKAQADKEYIEKEFNVLTGDLTITSTEKSIRLKVNDTIKLEGIGEYLSGLYFVASIRRTLSKDGGYSHVISLIRNGFGDSVKKAPPEQRKEEVPKTSPELKIGDSVRIVGDDAIYSNAHDGVKVPAWVKQQTLTIRDVSDDKNRVLLMPIFSWTYVKFIQKV